MSPAEILKLFQNVPNRCEFAPYEKAIRAAIQQREQITPELIALIERATFDPAQFKDSEDYRVPLALCLLAQFREQQARNAIIRFVSLPDEVTHELVGDMLTTRGNALLASVCGGNHQPLLRLVLNEEIDEYIRAEAISGILVQEIWGERSRKEVVDDLRKLFQTLPRPGNDYVWAELIGAVCDCPAPELEAEIRQAFAEKLPDETCVGDLKTALQELTSPDLSRLDRFRTAHSPIDTVQEFSYWPCFQDETNAPFEAAFAHLPAPQFLLEPEPQPEPGRAIATGETPYLAPPKPGRNDPCSCGSGLKYKKCCALKATPSPEPAPAAVTETPVPDRVPDKGMFPFHLRVPVPGLNEIRSVQFTDAKGSRLKGEYAFLELYCIDANCDCRRVLFSVVNSKSPKKPQATINFGWEPASFYASKFGGDTDIAREITEADLDPLCPQSPFAEELLLLFREVLMSDSDYVARLARHYQLFKQSLRDSSKSSTLTPGRIEQATAKLTK